MSDSVLSKISLGLPEAGKVILKPYRRNGFFIKRLKRPPTKKKRYSEVVVPPRLRWYPSKTSNFTFAVELDPDWIHKHIVPPKYNPAVWVSTKKRFLVLRVPKDWGNATWRRLYKKGFWYHTIRREWYLRRTKRK